MWCYLDPNYTTMAGIWEGLNYSCNPQHCYHSCRSHIHSTSSDQHYSWTGAPEIQTLLPIYHWWSSRNILAPVDFVKDAALLDSHDPHFQFLLCALLQSYFDPPWDQFRLLPEYHSLLPLHLSVQCRRSTLSPLA